MHILICDDDAIFAARVETLVRDFFARRGLQVECTVCHSGEETLARRDLDLYQVALLDVDLDTMNGISLGKQLRQCSPEICLVYVSAYLEFAPEGYTVNAFRYILKRDLDCQLPRISQKGAGHGFGLWNVRDVLKKYGGEYTISCRGCWFRFTCTIPLRKL